MEDKVIPFEDGNWIKFFLPDEVHPWPGDNDEAGNEEYKELLKELNSKVEERIQNDYDAFPKTERDCE